jgi:hypothetical protein
MRNYCVKRKNKTKIPRRQYRSKINQKIVETEGKLIPRTHIQFIHNRSLFCLGMVINDKDVHRRYTLHEHLGSPPGLVEYVLVHPRVLVGYVLVHPRVWWGMCWLTPGFGGVRGAYLFSFLCCFIYFVCLRPVSCRTQSCKFLRIVHSLLSLRFSLTVICISSENNVLPN